jgi:hypothetical protein
MLDPRIVARIDRIDRIVVAGPMLLLDRCSWSDADAAGTMLLLLLLMLLMLDRCG